MPTLNISLPHHSYPIKIQPLEVITHPSKVLLVSNPKISGLYLNYILPKIKAKEVYICTIDDGEDFKIMRSIERILQSAFIHQLDRKSLMISLGGGVISDMVGFASGIFMRGIDFISIPTTLLAQVDASVGGKCGINNEFGKNLVGIFHQPKAVHIDTTFLRTLPRRELNVGIAEMIKMAVCFDKDGFEALLDANLNDLDVLEKFIYQAIETKARVITQDEKEQGLRTALNYGHTFAHIIENLTNYKTYLHGEAVGIGMLMANELALNLGLLTTQERDKIKAILEKYNLNIPFKIRDIDTFYNKFFLDKKSNEGKITFVLPNGIGDVAIRNDIPKNKIIEVLRLWS